MRDLFAVHYAWLIPLLPLIGAAISGFFGARFLKQKSHWPIWLGVGASAVISVALLVGMIGIYRDGGMLSTGVAWFNWISVGDFKAAAGAWMDPLTAMMLCVVTVIGFFITVFAAGYMKGEEGYFRFFAYLGLFIFMMTVLVMGDNLIMLYLGWEGVGLCSYLLIGYYYERPSAREAAKKAFLVNRIGDFGFGLGIMLCFMAFGTVSYFGYAGQPGLMTLAQGGNSLTDFQRHAMQWIPFLLMLGAFGKSAQFPLHVWLPDAMEGPTPVSALIHAATMVTAGIYMIVRCGVLFVGNAPAMHTIAVVGMITALLGATIALRQFDLKKVFAYSTISQLGFMFVAVGCLAPVAGAFHLVTHAFFKALLFLSSGVVMHAMAGELDLRKMSGLKRVLPKTRWLMLIGCLALAGCPPFSGFFSKDEIVAAAWTQSRVLGVLLLFTAFLTAYYTFRLYFRVFEGPEVIPAGEPAHKPDVDAHLTHDPHHGTAAHGHNHHHNHEPAVMILPLIVLALGAIVAGALNFPSNALGKFLGHSPSMTYAYHQAVRTQIADAPMARPMQFGQVHEQEILEHTDKELIERDENLHHTMMIASALIALLGIWLAYVMHLKDRGAAERLAARFPAITRLLEARYWIDEIYQKGIVETLRTTGRVFFLIDQYVIDGIVWIVGFIPQAGGFALKITTQRGYLQGYAAAMLFGIIVILMFVLL